MGSIVNALEIIAVALVAAGVLGLIYGGFGHTKKSHEPKLACVAPEQI